MSIHIPQNLLIASLCVLIGFGLHAAEEPLAFTIDTAAQVNGGDVTRQVESFWHHKGKWKGAPKDFSPDPAWLHERTEGVIRVMSGDYGMSQVKEIYEVDGDGNYQFKPPPRFVEMLDRWSGQPDVGIWMNLGTNSIPEPLIEGGFQVSDYHYNVRQPNDYEAYYQWLLSFFDFILDRYGRDEVERWVFQYGFEADWQTKFLKPGTKELMSKQENRREFIRLLDTFHAAATETIGPGAGVACYFALITQANPYFRHWATGTNYHTGETGTRIAFVGFSDWYHIGPKPAGKWYDPDTFKMSPFTKDQSGEGNALGNAYVGGMKFKYDYLMNLIKAFPQMDYLQFYVPESGYIQVGSKHPAPLTFADHYGAAIYALRTIAFAHFPKIIMAGNNFALSTGDRGAWYGDAAKPPVFNIMRIQKAMADQRILPLSPDLHPDQPTEIRALATAEDPTSGPQKLRFLATNFDNFFHKLEGDDPANTRSVQVRLTNLPDVDAVTITPYRIDAEHNNWWPAYLQWREDNGLEMASSGYGVWSKYDEKYAAHVNDPMGTLRPKDRDAWLAKSDDIAEHDDLKPTGKPVTVPVKDGVAEWTFELPESAVMYAELEYEVAGKLQGFEDGFSSQGWQRDGQVVAADQDGSGGVRLMAKTEGAWIRTELSGLPAGAQVTFAAELRVSARSLSAELFAGHSGGEAKVKSAVERSTFWTRAAVTMAADGDGRLLVGASIPQQPVGEGEYLALRNPVIYVHE